MTCLLLEYFSQPQRSILIFFWQNENISKKTCIENNENHQSEDLDLTRQSAYKKKTFWTNGFERVVFAVDG